MSLVWEHAPYSEGSLLVLLALADWADDNGIAWPSIPKLAHKARLQRRRVQYIVRKLASDGFIDIDEGTGRGKQHRYSLNIEKLKSAISAPFVENTQEIKGAINAPFPVKGALGDIERVHFGPERVHSDTQRVHSSAPDPLEEPLADPSVDPPYSGADFLHALSLFRDHRKQIKKPLTLNAEHLLFKKLSGWGERQATVALEDAVINRWQGVFEPKNGGSNGSNKPGYESATERNSRNLRENAEYIRSISDSDSETDSKDPIGLLTSGF